MDRARLPFSGGDATFSEIFLVNHPASKFSELKKIPTTDLVDILEHPVMKLHVDIRFNTIDGVFDYLACFIRWINLS